MTEDFSRLLPLSRSRLDRDYLAREREDAIELLWADPSARVLPLFGGEALVDARGALVLLPPAAVGDPELRVYLGRGAAAGVVPLGEIAAEAMLAGGELPETASSEPLVPGDGAAGSTSASEPGAEPVLAAVIDDPALADSLLAAAGAGASWANLRRVGATLDDRDAGLFTQALAMANWHQANLFSPRTGVRTTAGKAGWVRIDPEDGREVFPRTDPAVIVGVLDADDRLLLGNNALWERNRFSLVAGFVEPGESLESAVQREVFEETGLVVAEPRYLGSQPWPFPASLMLGFVARVAEGASVEPKPDGVEIVELRWFSREELAASLEEIQLPGSTSIARAIIEDWYGGPLDQDS